MIQNVICISYSECQLVPVTQTVCSLQGLLSPGDEVILFEPAFDVYIAQTKMAGGVPKMVPLRWGSRKIRRLRRRC